MQKSAYIPYLTLNDYLTTIRSDQLNNQLLDTIEQGGQFERMEAESFAIDEIRSVLGSYFYLDFELRPTLPFIYLKKYYAGDRIVLDFPLWEANDGNEIEGESETTNSDSYVLGDCVVWNPTGSNILTAYCANKDNNDRVFNPDNWTVIGNQYDIYFVQFPYDIFQLVPSPQIGTSTPGLYNGNPPCQSRVCWEKNLYLCRNNTWIIGHQGREQFYSINDIPSPNLFPNMKDPNFTDGNRQWQNMGCYFLKSILPSYPNPIDSELINENNEGIDAWTSQYTQSWTLGDNRSNVIKQIIIKISLYELLKRNSFMLKERSIDRDWAFRKLERIRKGEDTTLIPILQPEQIGDISFGGMPKIINTF